MLNYTDKQCDVSSFNEAYGVTKGVNIVSAATYFYNQENNEYGVLIVHQALHFPDMDHSLLNPNQIRYNGNDVWDNPFDNERPLAMVLQPDDETGSPLTVPIEMQGTILSFHSRTPTQKELDAGPWYHLTLDADWHPQTVQLVPKVAAVQSNFQNMERGQLSSYRSIMSIGISSVEYDLPEPGGFQSTGCYTARTPEDLSNLWFIGIERAKKTLAVTTQNGIRSATLPLFRRLRSDRFYQRTKLRGQFSTDTVFGRHSSLTGNTCMQVFSTKSMFAVAYPMKSKSEAGLALRRFIREWGIPEMLTFDESKEQSGHNTEFMKLVRKYDMDYHISEPHQHNQNPVEGTVRELRRRWFTIVRQKHVPPRLWDYGYRWCCEIMSRTVNSVYSTEGRTPIEEITGDTPDISEYMDFCFYDFIWYRNESGFGENKLGRWLGVSHMIGPAMAYYVLTATCQVVSRTAVSRITRLEHQDEQNKALMKKFDDGVNPRLANDKFKISGFEGVDAWQEIAEDHDSEYVEEYDRVINDETVPEADVKYTPDSLGDPYVNKEVAVANGPDGEVRYGKVVKRKRNDDGNPVGIANENPIKDTRMYEGEFVFDLRHQLVLSSFPQSRWLQAYLWNRRRIQLCTFSCP